jgi:hypothetical protein
MTAKVLSSSPISRGGHPTVKPTAMLEDTLLDLTSRGDMVIDPFLGSRSTLVAADNTERVSPADQGLFFGVARVVGAVMSSAFRAENWIRWP